MPIDYQCPHCGAAGIAEDQFAGQSGNCAACGQTLTIPFANMAVPPAKKKSSAWIILLAVGAVGLVLLPCCVAALLPAVSAAREAARRNECSANMKQVVKAMYMHEDSFRKFPPAVFDAKETGAEHSWRSRLLPFIGGKGLFDQIDFEEAWDNGFNVSLHGKVIPVYRCPSASDEPTNTNYLGVVGEGGFAPDGQALRASSFVDGMTKTILIIEGHDTGTHWMEPKDFEFDSFGHRVKRGPGGPDSGHPGLVMAGFADGSVHAINEDIDPEVLKALMTRNGRDSTTSAPFFRGE